MIMKITFVHHSCFIVELESHILVFDYFSGDRVTGYHFKGMLPEFGNDKQLYFFASHRHQDHFDLNILRLREQYPDVRFILSKDIRLGRNYLLRHGIESSVLEQIIFVSPQTSYKVDELQIRTLRSTDAGVAFLVEAEYKNIYHAGDLHNWSFENSGKLLKEKMEREYEASLNALDGIHIHAAFVVLDPRLGKYTNMGMDYFLHHFDVDYVFPMHMWQQYHVIPDYQKMCSSGYPAKRLISITAENQVFEL